MHWSADKAAATPATPVLIPQHTLYGNCTVQYVLYFVPWRR